MVTFKEEHQRFMTGHTGTSFDELVLVFSAAAVSTAFRDVVLLWTNLLCNSNSSSNIKSLCIRLLIDYGIIVMPSLLIMTVFSDRIVLAFSSSTIFTIVLYMTYILKDKKLSSTINLHNVNLNENKTFVTNFRSIVNLITALAILAVDFKIFPRKLAKTEEFGYGMMDFGVGFFVIANAIVSPEARGKESSLSKVMQLKKAVVSSLPILVLGLLRLISVKGTDYQEHITEYGVHWNFFFTLAALRVLSTLLFCVVPHIKPGITGTVLMLGHQYCLSNGLSDYIVLGVDGKGGRTTLVDANREGIFSLPGYISLYMMGVQLGRFLFIRRTNLWEWLRAVVYMFLMLTVLVFINRVVHGNVQLVSRRFVNAAYILSSMVFCYISLMLCLIGDIAKTYCLSFSKRASQEKRKPISNFTRSSKPGQDSFVENNSSTDFEKEMLKEKRKMVDTREPCLLQAISLNSLLFFLVANVMTGFVNLSMSTIHANTPTAMAVLVAYSFLLSSLFVVLYFKNIKTKFW